MHRFFSKVHIVVSLSSKASYARMAASKPKWMNQHWKKERNNPKAENGYFDNGTTAFDNLRNAKKSSHKLAAIEKYQLHTTGRKKEELLQSGRPNFDHVGKRSLEIVMVAGKPSMAQELSKVLAEASQNHRFVKTSSSNGELPIYEFSGQFYGYPANFRMTSTFGNIFTKVFDNTNIPTKKLFDADIVNREGAPKKEVPKMLAEISKGCDALVLWPDCDLNGEAICFEIIDCVKDVLMKPPNGNIMDVVYRAKFSAVDEAVTAIYSLVKPDYFLSQAAIAKHKLDLIAGFAFSRYQTTILRRSFPNHYIPHLSYGPCQTLCLAFVVNQYLEVQSHVETYNWKIAVALDLGNYELEIISNPVKSKPEAEQLYEQLKVEQNCKVVSVKRKDDVKEPPEAMNFIEFLKKASEYYGIGPEEAMNAAHNLYEKGLISYPHTETTKYPKNLEVAERINIILDFLRPIMDKEDVQWESVVVNTDAFNRGHGKGDHPPIIPTRKAVTSPLSKDETAIYELICRHFLASFMPVQRYCTKTIVFSVNNMKFTQIITVVDDYGFTKILPWERTLDTRDVPTGYISNGNILKIKEVEMKKTTNPSPSLLTEAELIEKMEKHSIGTDASISNHISTLLERNYVTIDKETRKINPTPLGIQLIKAYQECVPKLIEPTLRAEVEAEIMKIATGEKEFEEFRSHVLEIFKEQFKIFKKKFSKFSKDFETCFKLKTDGNRHHKFQRNPRPDEAINDFERSR